MPAKKKKEKREAETEEPRRKVKTSSQKEINRVSDEMESIEKEPTGLNKPETAGTQPRGAARVANEEPRREAKTSSQKEINRVSDEKESIEKKPTGLKKPETAGTQPPGAARPVTQYLVTVDDLTQQPIKVEKVLDEKTGKRVELTRTEYAALYTYGITGYSTPQAAASSAYAAGNPALVLAYFQGVSDYLKNAGFK
jgi:hypothetical protein